MDGDEVIQHLQHSKIKRVLGVLIKGQTGITVAIIQSIKKVHGVLIKGH